MGTCSFWHKWILVVWLIIGNGRSGDVKVAARRKRPGCHLCRLWVKKKRPGRNRHLLESVPFLLKRSSGGQSADIRPFLDHYQLETLSQPCPRQSLRLEIWTLSDLWPMSENVSEISTLMEKIAYFAIWHFKRVNQITLKVCLHQKYEITPFKRMKNVQEFTS